MAALDADVLRAALGDSAAALLERIETFAEIDSTNSYLAGLPPPAAGRCHVVYADHQTAGRGRRDRRWHSESGKSLCLSVAWQFEPVPDDLPALTLAHGAAIVHALTRIGAEGLGIKWPNDILVGDAKLGGVLTETQVRGAEGVTVVTGVGINLEPVAVDLSAGGWSGAVASLDDATSDGPDRLHIAVAVIEAMVAAFDNFAELGLDAFRERYERYDALVGRDVDVETPDGLLVGTVLGIDEQGALLVNVHGETRRVIAGSIRRVSDDEAAANAGQPTGTGGA